jgi:hypothetical protein
MRSNVGAKLASSSDGSPECPVKVLVIDDKVGCGVCVGGDAFPKSVEKIGEGVGSSVSVPMSCDGIGEGSATLVPIPKIGKGIGSSVSIPMPCDGIGEGGATSVHIPKMCAGGGRLKEAVKVGVSGGDGSLEHVPNIGCSRLRVDRLGQLYVLDSKDEGIGMEAGL